ncbi:GNAT family N-acetyltransferase [Olivibacter ginsenosidimutans]
MKHILLRKASLGDLPILEQLLQELVEAERPFDETLKEGVIHYYPIKELIESDDAAVLVLEEEDHIVGCGYAQIKPAKPYLRHQTYAHLGFMFVRPAYRGRGLNQQLIGELKHWAVSKGTKEIRLEVYAENSSAIKAYEKAGFKKLLTTMRCEVQ